MKHLIEVKATNRPKQSIALIPTNITTLKHLTRDSGISMHFAILPLPVIFAAGMT